MKFALFIAGASAALSALFLALAVLTCRPDEEEQTERHLFI
jgi:hypothetical protein